MKKMFRSLMVVMGFMLVVACGDKPAPATVAVIPAPPPPPAHLYSLQDGSEYGYEAALSDEQRQQGRAASEIKMFSYLGRKGDTYQVMLKADEFRSVAECTKPCDFAKVYTFAGDKFIAKEVMRITPTVIVSAVFEDAMKGRLNQLLGQQKGVATTFWVDGDGKRLIVDDAKTSGVIR